MTRLIVFLFHQQPLNQLMRDSVDADILEDINTLLLIEAVLSHQSLNAQTASIKKAVWAFKLLLPKALKNGIQIIALRIYQTQI